MNFWLLVGLGLIGLAMLAFGLSAWRENQTNMPSRPIVGSDTTGHGQVLYSSKYQIYGKPDYIVEERVKGKTLLVPVELKPSRRSRRLYESDELQLVVYLLLLKENYPDQAASFGRISYAAGIPPFVVKLTPERIARVVKARQEVLYNRKMDSVSRSHEIKGKCLACGFNKSCSQSLD